MSTSTAIATSIATTMTMGMGMGMAVTITTKTECMALSKYVDAHCTFLDRTSYCRAVTEGRIKSPGPSRHFCRKTTGAICNVSKRLLHTGAFLEIMLRATESGVVDSYRKIWSQGFNIRLFRCTQSSLALLSCTKVVVGTSIFYSKYRN